MLRMYEAVDNSGATQPGTVVKPVDRHLSIYAANSEEAEGTLHRDVRSNKLPSGKVYQVCPWVGNAELIRSISFSLDGVSERVFLDPAAGPYGELRRIRLPSSSVSHSHRSGEQLDLFPPR